MKTEKDSSHKGTIVFLSHDASRTGAPVQLLNIMRWLRTNLPNDFKLILRQKGPLESQFREVAEVFSAEEAIAQQSFLHNVCLIYSNTITNGIFLRALPYGNIPIITHVHEMGCTIDLYGDENIREVKNHTVHFIACSNSTAAELIQMQRIVADRISVIPEAVIPEDIFCKTQPQTVSQIRNALGFSPEALVVTGCGTFDLRKGVDLFIQLAEFCARKKQASRELQFLWIGSIGDDPNSNMLRRDARKLESSLNLRLLGEVENPYPYIAASDLFCLPSREDPFPLVMLEAGTLGKPTLAFEQSGGAEEYCGLGGGFLVPYLDVAGMGTWILDHLMDRNTISTAGQSAKRLILDRYNMNATGPEFADLIARFMRLNAKAAVGFSQVFVPNIKGYSEESSVQKQVTASRWNRMCFNFRAQGFKNNWRVRIDPLDRTSIIEISQIVLKSAKRGKTLWKTKTKKDFDAIQVEGSAIRLADAKVLKLLSLGPDPILCLPALTIENEEKEFKLELVLRVDVSADVVAQHWQPLIQACREYDSRSKENVQLRTQLDDALKKIEKLSLMVLNAQTSIKGRRIFIWGTGSAGRHVADVMLSEGYAFRGFIDPDQEKTGKKMMNHLIFNPSILTSKSKKRAFVIIGSQFHPQISKRLRRMGFRPGIDFVRSLSL